MKKNKRSMNRRNFLTTVPTASLAIGAAGSIFSRCTFMTAENREFRELSTLEKVLYAMLSMQRATWEQGVAMQALLELGQKELVILMAKDAVLRQSADGRPAMLGEEFALTDAASPGEAILWAAKETGEEGLMNGYRRLLEYIMQKAPRTSNGIIYHFTHLPQLWSDSNYMLPPFLAVAGECAEAIKQIEGVRKFLWNPEKKLFSHMWDCEKQEYARKDYWGVGNGWTAAGYTRVITALPEHMKAEKEKLIGYVTELIDGCLEYMRDDGLFYNIVNNPDTFVETNLSQQLAYSIYKGIRQNWLNTSYRKYADKMRTAALSKVDKYGLVQGVCGSPEFDHAGTATEGQVFHILMETAYRELISA
jgi:rhamnogalacturonyl hydrolase YesR